MHAIELDSKINGFLGRKHAKFPELGLSGRNESRTVKYAESLRSSGQILFSR